MNIEELKSKLQKLSADDIRIVYIEPTDADKKRLSDAVATELEENQQQPE